MDGRAVLEHFLVRRVTPFLAERGFRRSGQRYLARRGANDLVVRFQRRDRLFTCDLIVSSATIREAFPETPDQHWAVRLGPVALGYDKWWALDEPEAAIAEDFLPAMGRGIDHIEPITTDEGLRDAILSLAMSDSRGLPPAMQEWAVALIRRAGPGSWGDDVKRRGRVAHRAGSTRSLAKR